MSPRLGIATRHDDSTSHATAGGVSRRGFLKSAAGAGAILGGSLISATLPQTGLGVTTGGSRLSLRAAASTATGSPLAWGLYANNPFGTLAEQRLILDAMRRALNEAPAGATAHVTAFTGIEGPLTDDIVAAHHRGVNCRVSMDNKMRFDEEQLELAAVLGTDRLQRSCFVSLVGTGRAGPGNAHGKLFAIDSTGVEAKPFTMVGSSNLGAHDTYQKWNTMFGVRHPRVYSWFEQVHEEMLVNQALPDPYRKGGPFGDCTTFVYPEPDPAWETDDCYEFFASIDPLGAQVYVSQHMWALEGRALRLAELMVSLVQRGATVFVNGGQHVRPAVIDYLTQGGVDAASCGLAGNGTTVWPHCKYWAVVSPTDKYCKVREGSLNTGSEDSGEEFAVEVKGRQIAEAYAQHATFVRQVTTTPPA